jgi:hypothetical protein
MLGVRAAVVVTAKVGLSVQRLLGMASPGPQPVQADPGGDGREPSGEVVDAGRLPRSSPVGLGSPSDA